MVILPLIVPGCCSTRLNFRGEAMEKAVCSIKDFLPLTGGAGAVAGGISSVAGLIVTHLFGGWSVGLEGLLIAMIIDYITGVSASFFCPELSLDSRIGFRGIVKKVLILLMVSMGHIMDAVIGTELVMPMVLYFYLANECLSITENIANAGVPIPNRLKSTLKQVREGRVKG